jgi:hypothetical protein
MKRGRDVACGQFQSKPSTAMRMPRLDPPGGALAQAPHQRGLEAASTMRARGPGS